MYYSLVDVYGEEALSERSYGCDYTGAKPVELQACRLKELLGDNGLTYDVVAVQRGVPVNAEDFFVIPRYEIISRNYCRAVLFVLSLLEQVVRFEMNNILKTDLERRVITIKQSIRTRKGRRELIRQQQGHDLLIYPAGFGKRYKCCSVAKVRGIMDRNEFGLGVYEVAIMLLLHPERLTHTCDLWIDCCGDESRLFKKEIYYSHCPSVLIDEDDLLEVSVNDIEMTFSQFGVATAFF